MNFAFMFIVSAVVFVMGYRVYGSFMAKVYDLNDDNKTPAECMFDGIDYCPAHPAVLLGHHFASIAGAGPITGPIVAASMFGWLPTLIWCIIGSTFLGGPHDMGALVSSMRHDGKSVGEVVERWIGHKGKVLFLWFTILALILVVAVFLVLSANTFAADPIVAFVGCLYIAMAVISGMLIYKFHAPLWMVTVVMLAIVAVACVKGSDSQTIVEMFKLPNTTWNYILALYILAASVLPVWLLLQPRDYLASYFLYFAVIIGAVGMLLGSKFDSGAIPMMKSGVDYFGIKGQPMWPMMFVIVACGAISGFHSLVGSGTTSKQLRKETDAVVVGYGSMLMEGLVACIAIGTLMVAGSIVKGGPVVTFAEGFGKFASLVGIDPVLGTRLGAIAINSFLLTSLDTATRLARYQIQELSGMKINKYVATIIAVVAALALVMVKTHDAAGNPIPAWKAIWPIFGAANQMVAALALLSIGVWVVRGLKKNANFLMAPFWFMLVTTMMALFILIKGWLGLAQPNYLLAGVASILFLLAVLLVVEAFKALKSE
ncbi:carbon starvation protein A [Dethiosulfovibrio sp. F2B]|uniref:carbon starvation CstA family protein n=1 Tax=Dethiosulfovibrio faecalis TaxID=2720018 RepID=UPI001F369F5C|nr:carbon starvation CstA family protein [Dethiosulfovibrio faecalis]MCF4150716.1 carbon starvation protein A [Dethiosulfovibrio faecalis]